jgi:hypothetical protein
MPEMILEAYLTYLSEAFMAAINAKDAWTKEEVADEWLKARQKAADETQKP